MKKENIKPINWGKVTSTRWGYKRAIAVVLSLVMVFSIMPSIGALHTVRADDGIYYLDENGREQTHDNVTAVTSSMTTWGDGTSNESWYVVSENTTISSRITVKGAVCLILANNATLTASAGINVADGTAGGNSLTIYAQSMEQSTAGQLVASGDKSDSGIGGQLLETAGTITINGGTIKATSLTRAAGIGGGYRGAGGSITINAGNVTASSGAYGGGAGIGGGYNGTAGTIKINGGTVTANGGVYSAGIGGGNITSVGENGTVQINGGTVTATGGKWGAGIGGGYRDTQESVIISGGTVTATGGQKGAGIGVGYNYDGEGGYVTISGGTVTAIGGTSGAGIGGGTWGGSGTFATTSDEKAGNACIVAKNGSGFTGDAIQDVTNKEMWSGVIIENTTGQVYGTSVELGTDAAIPSNTTLDIPSKAVLSTANGISLTNNGTIYIDGALRASINEASTGTMYSLLTLHDATASPALSDYEEKTYATANSLVTLQPDTPAEYKLASWGVTDSAGNAVTDVTIDSSNAFTMPTKALDITANFKKEQPYTADMFQFTAPTNLTYNAKAKTGSVEKNTQATGDIGAITIHYYDSEGNEIKDADGTSAAPVNAGTYRVKIDVAGTNDYIATEGLTSDNWTYTIAPKKLEAAVKAENKIYDQKTDAAVTAAVDTQIAGEEITITGLTGTFEDANVGEGKKVTIDYSNAKATGNEKTKVDNYSITYPDVATANITKGMNPSKPSADTVKAVAETIKGKGDGKITGVNDTMEYSKDGGKTYNAIPDGTTELTNLAAGTYLVRYKETQNYKASKTLSVKVKAGVPAVATKVKLNTTSTTLTSIGKTKQLKATATPSNAADKEIVWTSSNPNVATVDANGTVTAVGKGTAIITATVKNGTAKATCKVKINTSSEKTKTQLTLSKKLKVLPSGNNVKASWGKVSGADGYYVYVQYCGSDFATIPTATIKGNETTSVTVKKINEKAIDKTKTYKLYVAAYKTVNGQNIIIGKSICAHIAGKDSKKYTNPNKVRTTKDSYSLKAGKTAHIKASQILVSAKKKALTNSHASIFRYASSDKNVAAVDWISGKITAVAKGNCKVYVYARNGYAKTIRVTVS